MAPNRDRFRDFIRSFTDHWFNYMSAGPSVPAAAFALWVEPGWAKILLWMTAIFCVVLSAFFMWRTERRRVIDLEKVDREDLQHLLSGHYFGNTFVYPAVGFLCKTYTGKFALEQLKNGFDMISVRAPRNSVARLGFQFLNRKQETNKYAFYFQDGNGAERAIDNIHDRQTVLLSETSEFGLKLVCDEAFVLGENASLTIAIEAWTK